MPGRCACGRANPEGTHPKAGRWPRLKTRPAAPAPRTVDTDEQWLRRFLRFHQLRHPRDMGSEEVHASTQNQALSALLFLDRALLERDLNLEGLVRARKPQRLPVVLTQEEVGGPEAEGAGP